MLTFSEMLYSHFNRGNKLNFLITVQIVSWYEITGHSLRPLEAINSMAECQ